MSAKRSLGITTSADREVLTISRTAFAYPLTLSLSLEGRGNAVERFAL